MRVGRQVYNPVPIKVIAPLIREWNDKYVATKGEPGSNAYSSRYVEKDRGSEAGLEILGFQSGVSPKTLRSIMNGKFKAGNTSNGGGYFVDDISFDMADKIVCATVGPLGWMSAPLNEFYGPLDVTYGELSKGYELPEGYDFDSLPQNKKYLWSNARQHNARREVAA